MRLRTAVAILFVVTLVGTLLSACANDSGTSSGLPRVVATTQQIGALARAVAGDRMTVSTLIGPGVDPHDFEAAPDDVKRLASAKVVLRHGMGLDSHLDSAIDGSGARRVVTVTTGLNGLKSANGDTDPHVWHDPGNAKVMTENIVSALAAADPANADYYRQNAASQVQRLDDADRQIREMIATLPETNRKMVTDHDAFAYFIQHFGLHFVGAVIPGTSSQGEASAQQIAALENLIRNEGVRAIFAENSLDPRVSKQIASDTGVKVVTDLYGDSLGKPGSGADTIEGMLIANATRIVAALR